MIAAQKAELAQIQTIAHHLADAARVAQALNAADTLSSDAQRQRMDAALRHMERARATLANAEAAASARVSA